MADSSHVNPGDSLEGIAVVGMAGRFPGAATVDELWKNLCDGVESVTFFTNEELLRAGVPPTLIQHPDYVKAKPVLEGMELFDAEFFGLNPRECEIMDPQHRVFLECAWSALENAGYESSQYDGRIGVFAGASQSTYVINAFHNVKRTDSPVELQQLGVGNGLWALSTRVSYKLGFTGPSLNVQTACSTSLAAVHLACQSLLSYQSDMALAGGVSIIVPNNEGYLYQPGGIFSPDGHCRAFDAKAAGTLVGDGVGIVVLKRLSDALADGDTIHAVITGSAMNNDGAMKVGFTAPSLQGQSEVIAEAQALAGVAAQEIGYIEAHGTGTAMGDPIEVKALTKVFRAGTDKKGFCALGSVKTNVGHLDTAAGITGLLKAVLSVKYGLVPPTLHFETPNPEMDLQNSPFYVNNQLIKWTNGKRCAGVSSFGFGGTNVHVILEQAPEIPPSVSSQSRQLLVLSARTEAALAKAKSNLLEHLKANPRIDMADVAYTLQMGRKAFSVREALVSCDREDAIRALEGQSGRAIVGANFPEAEKPKVAFLFSGQGSQHVNMAKDLYKIEPTFRVHVDQLCEDLQRFLKRDLRHILFADETDPRASEQLKQTQFAQPALFIIEYSMAMLWMARGIHPSAMIGHSIGEYTAACLAGVWEVTDALRLVAERGRLIQTLPPGEMLAVPISEERLQSLIPAEVSLAAINSPGMCVASGPPTRIDEFEAALAAEGIHSQRLHTSHAFHSAMLEPILEPFAEKVGKTRRHAPRLPFISNVTGTWITDSEAVDPGYWANHLRQAVRFSDGMAKLLEDPSYILLEVGPGQTLKTLARAQPRARSRLVLSSLSGPNPKTSDREVMLESLGRLWAAGLNPKLVGLHENEKRRRVPLPTYPFERQRYWIDSQPIESEKKIVKEDYKAAISEWFYVPAWKQTPRPEMLPRKGDALNARWVLFLDELGIGDQLACSLANAGHSVIKVRRGSEFAKNADNDYTINPDNAEEYISLIRSIECLEGSPIKVVHLWAVSSDSLESNLQVFHETQEIGFYSLLSLVKAIGNEGRAEPVEINVVSSGLYRINSGDALCPRKVTMLALCKIAPQEYSNIACRIIDVDMGVENERARTIMAADILSECCLNVPDAAVAYREHQRWVQTFERARLPYPDGCPAALKPSGVYLIIGGSGSIGLTMGRYLAQTVQAKLVLVSRRELPSRDRWQNWVAEHEADDSVTRIIHQVQALESLGSEVLLLSADIGDLQAMRRVVAKSLHQFGRIDGVIHAAGIVVKGQSTAKTIQEVTRADCDQQFRSKVEGLFVLQEALRELRPDFCLFVSSLSAILGGLGTVAYTAANLYLDAFARQQNENGNLIFKVINLDTWDAGHDQETDFDQRFVAQAFDAKITPADGAELFARIFALPGSFELAVSISDLQLRAERWISFGSTQSKIASQKNAAGALYPRPTSLQPYVAPSSEVETKIAEIWQEVLGIDKVGANDNFFELGGNSLLATQLATRLRNVFATEIPLRSLFEASSVAELALIVEEVLIEKIEAMSAAPAADHEQGNVAGGSL